MPALPCPGREWVAENDFLHLLDSDTVASDMLLAIRLDNELKDSHATFIFQMQL